MGKSGALRKKLEINLALQGGGAHGAFTWGVLDRLLEESWLKFSCISGTSAGAVNAVALASGLAQGSREKARQTLFSVWQAVHKAGVPDLARINPFFNGLSRSGSLTHMASLWSPYEFNPMGFDPLRRLLTDHVDFDLLRKQSPVELLIAATHVESGQARLFRTREVSIETVLASACLPTLHHAVEIDGAAYWDGGFSANPDLVTLAVESPAQDSLLVTVSPRSLSALPTTARDIANQANRLTFNAPLIRDIELIAAVRETAGSILPKGRLAPLCRHRFHLIDGSPITGAMNPETIIKPDWGVITYLHGAGRDLADTWLSGTRGALGRYETVDLATHFAPQTRLPGHGRTPAIGAAVAPDKRSSSSKAV
jgi:NTE family protein